MKVQLSCKSLPGLLFHFLAFSRQFDSGDCRRCAHVAIKNLVIDGNRRKLGRVLPSDSPDEPSPLVLLGNNEGQVVRSCNIRDPRCVLYSSDLPAGCITTYKSTLEDGQLFSSEKATTCHARTLSSRITGSDRQAKSGMKHWMAMIRKTRLWAGRWLPG